MEKSIVLLVKIIAWCIIELGNVYLFFNYFISIERKQKDIMKIIIRIIAYVFIVLLYWYLVSNNFVVVKLIVAPLMLIKTAIFYSGFYCLNKNHIGFIIFFVVLVSLIGLNVNLVLCIPWVKLSIGSYIDEVIGNIVLIILLVSTIIMQKKEKVLFIISDLSIMEYLLFATAMYSAGVWEAGVFNKLTVPYRLKALYIILLISIIIIIFRAMIMTRTTKSLRNVNILLLQQMKQTTNQYKQLTEKDIELRKFRHDIRNLLMGLYSLIQDGKNIRAKEYIVELENFCDLSQKKYSSGNYLADIILTSKDELAKTVDAEIEFEGEIPTNKISDVDIVIVLSNALDNAIEACDKIVGHKKIKVNSILRKSIWIIKIENPSQKVIIRKNHIDTSKKQKDIHGFGLNNIEKTTHKYRGDMKLEYDNSTFSIILSFLLKET